MIKTLRQRAKYLKSWTFALFLAYQDPRVPSCARLVAICVVAYAFSPIDLIPDFVPVLGYLDDLILLPLGISLAIRLIPRPVLEECRLRAQAMMTEGKPTSWFAAGVIIALWLFLVALGVVLAMRAFP